VIASSSIGTLLKLYETKGAIYRLPVKYWVSNYGIYEPDGK